MVGSSERSRQQLWWTLLDTVNTVMCSWWWAKTSPETCTATWNNKLIYIVRSKHKKWKTNWCHCFNFIHISTDLYMFRAHRPIFRRIHTAVHTTIGSVSVPFWSRVLCVVAGLGVCSLLYSKAFMWFLQYKDYFHKEPLQWRDSMFVVE